MHHDDDDNSLFRRIMQDVTPLKQNKQKTARYHAPISPHKRKQPTPETLKREPTLFLSDPYEQNIYSETILSYGYDKLPAKRFKQLKQGEIVKQARLDLHGLHLSDARESLVQFITNSHASGFRCVLIIHGKGGLHGEVSILKSHVNHWLKQFTEILAFHSTLPKDGGTGALYVLLKSNVK